MTLKKGWLDRQLSQVSREVKDWPEWMKREAGFAPDPVVEREGQIRTNSSRELSTERNREESSE